MRSPAPLASGDVSNVQNIESIMKKSSMVTVPPFKPIPPAPDRSNPSRSNIATPAVTGIAMPPYNSPSISRLSTGHLDAKPDVMAVVVPMNKVQTSDKLSSTNFALRTLPSPNNELPPPLSNSVQAILAANNITESMFQNALLQKAASAGAAAYHLPARPKPTPITTQRPSVNKFATSVGKVMNAPKEYYPVGYDKNFDDNFASRVELPETSFYCGDQKHFPGLYADEDLGCMVSSFQSNYN